MLFSRGDVKHEHIILCISEMIMVDKKNGKERLYMNKIYFGKNILIPSRIEENIKKEFWVNLMQLYKEYRPTTHHRRRLKRLLK